MLRMTAHDAYLEATRQEDGLFSTLYDILMLKPTLVFIGVMNPVIKTNWRLIYETTNSTRSAGVE